MNIYDPDAYENKFAEFLRMIRESKEAGIEAVMIPSPQTLGDNYEEMTESLGRLADAGLALVIVPRGR